MESFRIINQNGKADVLNLNKPAGEQIVFTATGVHVLKRLVTGDIAFVDGREVAFILDVSNLELQDSPTDPPYWFGGTTDTLLDIINNQYLAIQSTPNANEVVINEAADYPAVNGIVTFEAGKSYIITASIDWGNAIFVIEDGCNVIRADNNSISIGSSSPVLTGNYNAIFNFLGANKVESITLDGYDSPVRFIEMDASLTSPIGWLNVNLGNSINGGFIRNFGNAFFEKCGFFNFANLAFVGEIQTLAITSTKTDAKRLDPSNSNAPLPCIIFDTTMKVNRRLRVITSVGESDHGGAIFDYRIPDTNIGTERFIFDTCEYDLTNGSTAFTGITEDSLKAHWIGNIGMPNTFVGGDCVTTYLAGQEPSTAVTQNNFTDIIANITGGGVAGAEFSVKEMRLFEVIDNGGTPAIKYIGEQVYRFKISASWTTSVAVNRVIGMRLLVGEMNDSNVVITPPQPVEGSKRTITTNGSGRPETVDTSISKLLKKNDFIALQGANFTNASSIETITLATSIQLIP